MSSRSKQRGRRGSRPPAKGRTKKKKTKGSRAHSGPKHHAEFRGDRNRKNNISLVYDEDARREFLTGFQKRKNERRKVSPAPSRDEISRNESLQPHVVAFK